MTYLETKGADDAPSSTEVKNAVAALTKGFEDFKTVNDDRLKEIEAKGKTDPLIEEKLNKHNTEVTELQGKVDELLVKMNRPNFGGDGEQKTADVLEHDAKYNLFLRKGNEVGLADLEAKALNLGVNADGGFAVTQDLDRTIDKYLVEISPIRQEANVVQVGNSKYEKLVNIGGSTSGWVGETAVRPETNTPQLASIVPPLGEIYANPAATQGMLDDAFFNVENWLAEELSEEFSLQENSAFVSGNGTNKPKGFLAYVTSVAGDATRTFGQVQATNTGVAGGWAAANPSDILIDLIHQMKGGYRNGAKWFMENTMIAEIRKFKDSTGDYLWKAGIEAGRPQTLLGYDIIETPDMPVKAVGSLSVLFANMRRGYTITDRMGTRILRDPYTNKPKIHFYTTKRVGGAIMNDQCFKLLKFAL